MKNSNFKLSSALSVGCFCAVINLVNASTGADDDRGNIKFHQRNTIAEANRTSENNRKTPPIDFNKLSAVGLGHLIMDSLFNATIIGEFKSTETIKKHDELGKVLLKQSSSINMKYGCNNTNPHTENMPRNPYLSISYSQNKKEKDDDGSYLGGSSGSVEIDPLKLSILIGIGCKGVKFILKHAPK
jgi:hypothetical protein